MATARFLINSSPSVDRGFDATHGQTLTLRLEGTVRPDVWRVQFFVYNPADPSSPLATKDSPVLTLVPSNGVPTTVDGQVSVTLPTTGTHSYAVRCIVNNGVDISTGAMVTDWIHERIVAIRSDAGCRKILPSESTQYEERGWGEAINELVDSGSGAVGPTGPPGATGPSYFDTPPSYYDGSIGCLVQHVGNAQIGFSGTGFARIRLDGRNAFVFTGGFVPTLRLGEEDQTGAAVEGNSLQIRSMGDASPLSLTAGSATSGGRSGGGIWIDLGAGDVGNGGRNGWVDVRVNGVPMFELHTGYGSPEGVVAAKQGSFYANANGGAGVTWWVKETGGTGNTGWVAK